MDVARTSASQYTLCYERFLPTPILYESAFQHTVLRGTEHLTVTWYPDTREKAKIIEWCKQIILLNSVIN